MLPPRYDLFRPYCPFVFFLISPSLRALGLIFFRRRPITFRILSAVFAVRVCSLPVLTILQPPNAGIVDPHPPPFCANPSLSRVHVFHFFELLPFDFISVPSRWFVETRPRFRSVGPFQPCSIPSWSSCYVPPHFWFSSNRIFSPFLPGSVFLFSLLPFHKAFTTFFFLQS